MEHERLPGCRRPAVGCLAVLGALLLCLLTMIASIDIVCYHALTRRMPVYPGAEIGVARHNLLRRFGMGETYLVLYTPDPPDTVREWYGRTVGPYLREAAFSGDVGFRLSDGQWTVTRGPDGEGSEIRLYGSCAQ